MSETDRILWQAEIMRKFGSETGSERNANYTVRSSEINIDVVRDEIGTLQEELSHSDDPAAQKRIKELIDERESLISEQEAGA